VTSASHPPADASSSGNPPERGVFGFLLLWFGQFVSLVGSRFTGFAFGIYLFQQTQSASAIAAVALLGGLPALLLAPVAGALVDRWDRRKVMLASNCLTGLVSLGAGLFLTLTDRSLSQWFIYAYVGFEAILQAFHWPAYMAATPLLLPKKHIGRASGLVQLGMAFAGVLAPLPAPWLLSTFGATGIIWIDAATFFFAAATLLFVRIPKPSEWRKPQTDGAAPAAPPPTPAGSAPSGIRQTLRGDVREGWQFIRQRPGLLALLLYFAAINLAFSMATVLLTPLILSFATQGTLASIASAGSAGFFVGGLLMTLTGGPKRRMPALVGGGLLLGAALLMAAKPWPWLIGVGLFLGLFSIPVLNAASQTIWLVKTPPELQGRVFSVRRMIATFTMPVGQLLAGPLADYVFRPLLVVGGPLAGSVGAFVGVGPGRGIALLYMVIAILPIAAALWCGLNPKVRNVETDVADAI
jgi:MFS transporter, DHA3 family, macrolide efflux protein